MLRARFASERGVKLLRPLAGAGLFIIAIFVGQGIARAQTPDASATLSRPVQLTPKDQLTEADSGIARMTATRQTVSTELARARSERDVVKTLCLSDKLNQIDVAVRSAQDRRG